MRVIAGLEEQLPDSRPVLSGSREDCLFVERSAHGRASPCPQRTVCGPVLRLEAARLWQEDSWTEPHDEAAGFITLVGTGVAADKGVVNVTDIHYSLPLPLACGESCFLILEGGDSFWPIK